MDTIYDVKITWQWGEALTHTLVLCVFLLTQCYMGYLIAFAAKHTEALL